ncbi:hypothetical protein [Thalassovita sp.]|uniref:hypothetical protein n=1 Tax=Thalassovita sp. TaxID=1979401 RepID=UPI002B27614B|nr:hypothetical protein [Thalassovita sp.]
MLDLPFEVLSDGEKIAFLTEALHEASEAITVLTAVNQELHAFYGELLAAIKGEESNV